MIGTVHAEGLTGINVSQHAFLLNRHRQCHRQQPGIVIVILVLLPSLSKSFLLLLLLLLSGGCFAPASDCCSSRKCAAAPQVSPRLVCRSYNHTTNADDTSPRSLRHPLCGRSTVDLCRCATTFGRGVGRASRQQTLKNNENAYCTKNVTR